MNKKQQEVNPTIELYERAEFIRDTMREDGELEAIQEFLDNELPEREEVK